MATRFSSLAPSSGRDWFPVAVAAGCGLVAALGILALVGDLLVAAGFLAAGIVLGGGALAWRQRDATETDERAEDWATAHALAGLSRDAVAVTDRAGRLICANERYELTFAGFPAPPSLPVAEAGAAALAAAGRAAWRDGEAETTLAGAGGAPTVVRVVRAGADTLVWSFAGGAADGLPARIDALIAGEAGNRLASAGIMVALLGRNGRVRAANQVLRARAMGSRDAAIEGRDFARFLITDNHGLVRFEREGLGGNPLRVLQIPFLDDDEDDEAPMLVALIDEDERPNAAPTMTASGHIRALISLLPLGMALIDREGRFVHLNQAFATATGVSPDNPPLYPGDLVVREDKAALADLVRRFAGGAAHAGDMTVRLTDKPDEPIAITVAGARGMGDAAVLLTLKDNSEESRLKRQVAQATKMQAVGQLAGGVAHDFNNILTAIIGHCDLMLMRHPPGDSDYDDIQQIRANSNRAASLTRQLLAFSRQQTLRPQVLQLPDVISEVSNLLKRLLGETVELVVQHGRGLGAVRADPGQLEQVIVNLAVNARDAMLAKSPSGGGKLTIETRAVPASEVRRMADDLLPVGDYVALRVTDTGTGIPHEVLGNIFEPFFTTKEVGKGTGLGLSTVYGIIKQSGGFIFAESPPGRGASFIIYLPVHAAPAPVRTAAAPKVVKGDLWGSGTILLVEDEDMVRAVAERALTRQGYTVLTAENGEAAIEMIADKPQLDLLISDVVMPVIDGPTMVGRIRRSYPDLKVLFMSGYAEEQLRKSIDIDNVAFLPKPFSVQQLAEATRDVLHGD